MTIKLWQLKLLVNESYSLIKTLKKYNPEGRYVAGQPCFCPFHENTETPSAAIYDNEGSESLYCFSEKRQYKVTDALEKLFNYDVYALGMALWNKMSDLDKKRFITEHPDSDNFGEMFSTKEEKKEEINTELEKTKLLYKSGKASLEDLLDKYIN